MIKALKGYRIAAFTLFIIETFLLITVGLFWFFDWFQFQHYVDPAYVFLVCVAFFLVNALLYWSSLIKLAKLRQKNDVQAARLVGSDIEQAYSFGKIGLVVVDESNIVIWINELFTSWKVDIIDNPVFEWQPKLKDLVNAPANKVIKVEIKGQFYQVEYLSEQRLFIFKDCTDLDNQINLYTTERTVIGEIVIDNFNEVASETDESADFVNKVRNIITDYFREYEVLLRRVRNDTYFAVCNFASLEKLETDQFSVLEKVRQAGKGQENPLTLSIGFAYGFPGASKMNEMAHDAINMSLSRGGDQCVVSEYGADLRYFGGKTAAVETTSKVKVRSFADSFISLIKSSSSVFVMGHTEMDMDALGASLGVIAICDWCQKPCRLVYVSKNAEKKTRQALIDAFPKETLDKLIIDPDDAGAQIKESTLLVVVDISKPSMVMAPKLLDKASKVVVIDHHRRAEEFIDHPVLQYIETSASSASELLTEMIRYATANPRIELKPTFATLMLSGIFLDSNNFKSKSTGMQTFEAAEVLKDYGADNSVADGYLKDEFEEYSLINKIIATMQTPHYGIVYCVSDDHDIIERSMLAKVGNQLMQLKGINACFVIGRTEDKAVRLSARSDGTVNVQLLCEKMGGGGHFISAACSFNGQTVDKVVKTMTDVLDEYLDEARSSTNPEGNNI
jgi:c-di-AMP phosphodiesterase-like protein